MEETINNSTSTTVSEGKFGENLFNFYCPKCHRICMHDILHEWYCGKCFSTLLLIT